MLRVGLTGGIGSGKSTVAAIFETLGIPVSYADDEAKRLMNEDPALREAISREFGAEAYTGGVLNRKYLASQVFGDAAKLEQLNEVSLWIEQYRQFMERKFDSLESYLAKLQKDKKYAKKRK